MHKLYTNKFFQLSSIDQVKLVEAALWSLENADYLNKEDERKSPQISKLHTPKSGRVWDKELIIK